MYRQSTLLTHLPSYGTKKPINYLKNRCHYRLPFKILNCSCHKKCNRISKQLTITVFVEVCGALALNVFLMCFSKQLKWINLCSQLLIKNTNNGQEKKQVHMCQGTFKVSWSGPSRARFTIGLFPFKIVVYLLNLTF